MYNLWKFEHWRSFCLQKKNVKSSLHVYTHENNSFASFVRICGFCSESSQKIYSCFNYFRSNKHVDQYTNRHCNICNQRHNTLFHDYFERKSLKVSIEISGSNAASHATVDKHSNSKRFQNNKVQNSLQNNFSQVSKQNQTIEPSTSDSDVSATGRSCSTTTTTTYTLVIYLKLKLISTHCTFLEICHYYCEILINGIFRTLQFCRNHFGWVAAENVTVSYLHSSKFSSSTCVNCPKVSLPV